MKEKTQLERQIEASLAEWTLLQRIKERLNEYNFQQRIRKGLELLVIIDDNYVVEATKTMFGSDIILTQEQIDEFKPICLKIALEDLDKLYPVIG